MPRVGMLVQMDGSYHPWLGDQVPPFTLLIAVDDATGTVAGALFCDKEEAYTYSLLIQDLVQSVGIPVALYIDRQGSSGTHRGPASPERQPSSAGRWTSWGYR